MPDEGMSKCVPLITAAVATANTRGNPNKEQTTKHRPRLGALHAPVYEVCIPHTDPLLVHAGEKAGEQDGVINNLRQNATHVTNPRLR